MKIFNHARRRPGTSRSQLRQDQRDRPRQAWFIPFICSKERVGFFADRKERERAAYRLNLPLNAFFGTSYSNWREFLRRWKESIGGRP